MILAGGRGERLLPLTLYRSKPAVPFGGIYRIVDFVLSNFVNSGIRSIYVLTQFKSQSLTEHIHRGWPRVALQPGSFIIPVPAQMQTPGEVWYRGTADAIYQNLNLIRETQPDFVCIFGGDHIYQMDVTQMLQAHVDRGADVTISAIPVALADAVRFGVIEADEEGGVRGFHEKVADPPPMPGDPTRCYASMGNYIFSREILDEMLVDDAANSASSHDFGADILPRMVTEDHRVYAYDFHSNHVPGRSLGEPNTYWRDVGTLEAFYDANMDLKEVVPQLDVYNREWPIHTVGSSAAPAKFVHDVEGRAGEARQSIVSSGTIISGATVRESILGRSVRIHSYSRVEQSVIFDGVRIERGCKVRRAIIDKDVILTRNTEVGYDAQADRDRGWLVTEGGLTVIPKRPTVRPVTTVLLG